MKIPIKPSVLSYDSPTYNKIVQDVVLNGHQVISISGPRNSSKTFWELLFLFQLHEGVAGLVSIVCMKEYANISKTFIQTIKEISPHGLKDARQDDDTEQKDLTQIFNITPLASISEEVPDKDNNVK